MGNSFQGLSVGDESRLEQIESVLFDIGKDLRTLVEVQTHIVHILEDSRRTAERVGALENRMGIAQGEIVSLKSRVELQSFWLKRIGGTGLATLVLMVIYAAKTMWHKSTGL